MKILKNVLLSFICVQFFPVLLSDYTLSFSNSYFSILLWILLFMLLQYADRQSYDQRLLRFTHVLGFMFSYMTACGYAIEQQGTVGYLTIRFIICILLYTHVFALLLAALWIYLEIFEIFLQEKERTAKSNVLHRVIQWIFKHPVIIAILLLICWIPCYISTFPGGFSYDATPEFNQLTDGYNENFPMLHSVLITRILSIAHKLTGSYNVGIAIYTITQMILISIMFTHILYTFHKKHINRMLLCFMIIYYALFPVIPILVTHTLRDILFSALLTYTMFLFYLLASEKTSFMASITKPFLLGIIFVLTMLSRNNNTGVVMFIIVLGVSMLVWIMNKKENLRGSCIFAGTAIGGYLLLSIFLLALCQPRLYLNTQRSALSLFAQSIARAYFMEMDTWTEAEQEELGKYFRLNELRYVAENADPAKTSLHFADGKSLNDFFIFWCKIGLKHPGCFLDAILTNSKPMWFPGDILDGYKKVGGYEGYDKCYFYFGDTSTPGTNTNLAPKIKNYYEKISLYISFEKIPVISMLFSIGFQFWIVINCVFYTIYRKCQHLYLPLAIILGYTIISAFVPLILLRYFSALFFTFPMTIIFTLQPSNTPSPDITR